MRFLIISALISSCFFSCNPEKEKKADSGSDTLSLKYRQIMAGADSSWKEMMASEERKIENIKFIIKELGLIEGSSVQHLEQIKIQLEELKNRQYDRISMANSALIDKYDSTTNALISEIRKEINNNKEAIKYQVINQLMAEIQAADDSVLFLRKSYDQKIDLCRSYLDENKEKLKKFIPDLDSLKNLNYFRLNP